MEGRWEIAKPTLNLPKCKQLPTKFMRFCGKKKIAACRFAI